MCGPRQVVSIGCIILFLQRVGFICEAQYMKEQSKVLRIVPSRL